MGMAGAAAGIGAAGMILIATISGGGAGIIGSATKTSNTSGQPVV